MNANDDRLAAAMADADRRSRDRRDAYSVSRRSGYEAGIAAHRAKVGPAAETATYRIRVDALAAAAEAWPDRKTRSAKISELIVMAASEEIANRRNAASDPKKQG